MAQSDKHIVGSLNNSTSKINKQSEIDDSVA